MPKGIKTTEFLKECMADALIQLLSVKSMEKITIDEITTMAGVGRSTWFRNFKTKNEAITFKLIQLWKKWENEQVSENVVRYTPDNADTFFEFAYSIRKILLTIYNEGLKSCAYEAYCSVVLPSYNTNPPDCYGTKFYAYGLFGMLDEWVKRSFKETPAEMVDIFYRVIEYRNNL